MGWKDDAVSKVLLYNCGDPGSGKSWAQKHVSVTPAPGSQRQKGPPAHWLLSQGESVNLTASENKVRTVEVNTWY